MVRRIVMIQSRPQSNDRRKGIRPAVFWRRRAKSPVSLPLRVRSRARMSEIVPTSHPHFSIAIRVGLIETSDRDSNATRVHTA